MTNLDVEAPASATQQVYLLPCANGTIYVGQAHDLERRLEPHFTGTGTSHTAQVKPLFQKEASGKSF